ncbi:LacI family DNA-binding transcriptional regulator [Granulicella sp. 5B5]|uniref:LacI family DNA-binding transcriptional regulator n=1 Tax=Granulicella sp. 5B5 TaxID=1617967 RepID=UPI002105D83C|nr:LacI family DNA-binding transcriptional regulator [Granulicella sp. 5B5]
MPRKSTPQPHDALKSDGSKPPGLKEIARYLGLSPASVSMVINDVPLAKAMTAETRARILEAVKKFNYRPNLLARSLSKRETRTIGVIVPESSDGYYTRVMRGLEEALLDAGYLYFTVSHLSREDLLREYPLLLRQRAVDGLIYMNTKVAEPPGIPAVTISYATKEPGVTSVVVDQRLGARLSLEHLAKLGHKRVLMMKGQPSCLESGERWRLMLKAAQECGIEVRPELSLEMNHDQLTPELAYTKVAELMRSRIRFTAVCAFNDTSAIGAMRALADAGLHCPDDVSVVGFDDIGVAGFYTPRLTTVRQPLEAMGARAVTELIARIREPEAKHPAKVVMAPELMVRESTAPVKRSAKD